MRSTTTVTSHMENVLFSVGNLRQSAHLHSSSLGNVKAFDILPCDEYKNV